MTEAFGEFVFGIVFLASLLLSLVFIGVGHYVLKQDWFLSSVAGIVCGFLLGLILSPYIFDAYLSFRGITL